MTLPPLDNTHAVSPLEGGPKITVAPYCSNPSCGRIAEHVHHIFRRSLVGGDVKWVKIEGEAYANITGLCPACHDLVTGRIGGHKAAIRFEDGKFFWCEVSSERGVVTYAPVGLLVPQPPTPDSLAARASNGHTESEDCPFCGQRRRREGLTAPRDPRRRRKSWTIKVPDDEEDGAEVLDNLLETLAPLLGLPVTPNTRYFVVVSALAYTQQSRHDFVLSIKGHG